MKFIKETLNDLVVFLKNPIEKQDNTKTIKDKIKILIVVLFIDFVVAGIIMGIAAIIEHFGLINTEDHLLYGLLEESPVWLILLLTVIIVPFIEELVFRLPLRFKYNYFLRFTLLLSYIAGKKNKIRLENCLKTLWNKYFRFTFYSIALVFGLVHLTNYDIAIAIIIFAPILICSQFVGGLLMGYLRVRYSFILGFILHAVYNGILIGASLIAMNDVEKLNIDYVSYSLKITEVSKKESESSLYGRDTITFNAVKMKQIIAYLVYEDEYFITSNDTNKLNTKIKLNFINHNFEHLEVKETILKHLSNTYNFEIKYKIVANDEVIYIQTADITKLMTNISSNLQTFDKSYYASSIQTTDNKIEMKNVTLNELARTLQTNYKKVIKYDENNLNFNKYDFTIPTKLSFEELKEHLYTNYGLLLDNSETEVEYVYVDFL